MKIVTNSQYHKALAEIETFIEKGFSNLPRSETTQLEILSKHIEEYESLISPMPVNNSKQRSKMLCCNIQGTPNCHTEPANYFKYSVNFVAFFISGF